MYFTGRLRSFDQLINARADNIFVLKFTYWLSR